MLAGGVDATALHPPKQFFGAARNIEQGGSLTILATALVDTGSATDEVILEEFTGTANSVLRLSGDVAARRTFPAVDVLASGTRREDLLLTREELEIVEKLRRSLLDRTAGRGARRRPRTGARDAVQHRAADPGAADPGGRRRQAPLTRC